jgi:hypothetical protein
MDEFLPDDLDLDFELDDTLDPLDDPLAAAPADAVGTETWFMEWTEIDVSSIDTTALVLPDPFQTGLGALGMVSGWLGRRRKKPRPKD